MKETLVPSSDVCAENTSEINASATEKALTASVSTLPVSELIATFNTAISSAAIDADKDESKFTSASDAEVKDATAAPASLASLIV